MKNKKTRRISKPEKDGEDKVEIHNAREAQELYIAGMKNMELQPGNSSRQQIIDELKSNTKSDIILERFFKKSGLPNIVLADQILEISPKTLLSYRNTKKDLPVRIFEHLLKLEQLYEKGIELFETSDHFTRWLKSPSYGLGYTIPMSLINSITGIDMVIEELIRIEFGDTA